MCNMKLDEVNYWKHRTVCKSCYKKNRRKNKNKTSHCDQKSKMLTIKTIELLLDEIQPISPKT